MNRGSRASGGHYGARSQRGEEKFNHLIGMWDKKGEEETRILILIGRSDRRRATEWANAVNLANKLGAKHPIRIVNVGRR